MTLPNYETPPISEVAMGISFKPITKLNIVHLGLFWEKIRDEYPSCEQRSPIGSSQPILSEDLPMPFPRTWFINEDKSHLLQLQNGKFISNWRRQNGDNDYPRYDILIEQFQNLYEKFLNFLQEEKLGKLDVYQYELDYTNHIFYEKIVDSLDDVNKIFPDFNWGGDQDRFLSDPEFSLERLHFQLPDDFGIMRIEIKHATRQTDDSPLFVLQIATRGISETGEMKDWFDLSHDSVVRGFADITSDSVQEDYWGKIDN